MEIREIFYKNVRTIYNNIFIIEKYNLSILSVVINKMITFIPLSRPPQQKSFIFLLQKNFV